MISGKISVEKDGQRLDIYLRERFPSLSRNFLKKCLLNGLILVNGKQARKNFTLKKGDEICLNGIPEPGELVPLPDPSGHVEVIYEDEDFVAVNKNSGIACAPLSFNEKGTVINFLLSRYPEISLNGKFGLEGGLLYRLDRGASGILLFGRNEEAIEKFKRWSKEKKVLKTYTAIVKGRIDDEIKINLPIYFLHGREKKVYTKIPSSFSCRVRKKYDAETIVIPLRPGNEYTLINAIVYTATRHQIRAHLAHIGHPVKGDTVYGKDKGREDKIYLHLSMLKIDGEEKKLTINSPPPWQGI